MQQPKKQMSESTLRYRRNRKASKDEWFRTKSSPCFQKGFSQLNHPCGRGVLRSLLPSQFLKSSGEASVVQAHSANRLCMMDRGEYTRWTFLRKNQNMMRHTAE